MQAVKQLKIATYIQRILGNNNIRAHETALQASAAMLLLNIDKCKKEFERIRCFLQGKNKWIRSEQENLNYGKQ